RPDASGARLAVRGDALLVPALGTPVLVLGLADGDVRTSQDLGAGDAALVDPGRLVVAPRGTRVEGREGGRRTWRHDALAGVRPYLALDADDGVVVVVVGWGQPETRD
ncbi:MAG: hypothetical protein JWO60_2889, partial [Frankiales bacterium]|nr:hypothetical protein [Frankiales bacterium]